MTNRSHERLSNVEFCNIFIKKEEERANSSFSAKTKRLI